MEKKKVMVTLLIAIVIAIIILAALFIFNKKPKTSPSGELEECKTLAYSGEGKTNIVFFAEKKEAEKYKNFFLTISPFNENEKEFNFYYLEYSPECEIYNRVALLCYNKEIVKKASSCPNDIIVVIKDEKSGIRSSSYMNVLSINKKLSLSVFPHEFAHAFANLADEYVPAELPRGSRNCVSDCNKFSVKDGCFEGCSKDTYFRSIDSGLMKSLQSSQFGKFNEDLILEKISKSSKITGRVIEEASCQNKEYYLIEGNYSQGKIENISKSIEGGCVGNNGAGSFSFSLILKNNEKYIGGEFNPEFIFTDTQNDTQNQIEGSVDEREGMFLLKVPIISEAKAIEINKEGVMINEISLEDIGGRPCRA